MRALVTLWGLLLCASWVFGQAGNRLEVKVSGIKRTGKDVHVAIFRPTDDFPNEGSAWKHTRVSAMEEGEGVALFDVPFGEYAVAVFLDENGNGKLDKNAIGVPKEQFGFSNNFRPRTGGPKFRNCRFEFSEVNGSISIQLK